MSFQISSVTDLPDKNAEQGKEVDQKDIGFPADRVTEQKSIDVALTISEREELKKCEELVAIGLRTFFEVGSALFTIRQKRLYRMTHTTFESYCVEKWQIGRSYASRMIEAAERLLLLHGQTEVAPPANECQIRPFLRLPLEQFPQAWRRAAERAAGRRVTGKIGQMIVNEISPPKTFSRPIKIPVPTVPKLPLGQILVLLHSAKKEIEGGVVKHALDYLDRIEQLLFGGEMKNRTAEATLMESESTELGLRV